MRKYIIYARIANQDQLAETKLQKQVDTLQAIARNQKIKVSDIQKVIGGSKSFLKVLLKRLYKGEKIGIICMNLERLTRDKDDLTLLVILLKMGRLKIITPEFTLSRNSLKNTLFMLKSDKKTVSNDHY